MRCCILVAGLIGSSAIGTSRAAAESKFEGQPLSYWRQRLQDPQLKVRQNAASSFATMDSVVAKEGLAELTMALRDENAQVRYFAAETLGRIGPNAHPALPELLKLVEPEKNQFLTSVAGVSIASIDPEFPELPKVVRILVRHEEVLGKSATKAPSLAGPFLRKFPDLAIRHTVPLLESEDRVIRRNAAHVLAAAGPPARERAEKALVKALEDEDGKVRAAVVDALFRVAPAEIRAALPVVIGLLGARQFQAYYAAEIFKPYSGEVCPRLIRALDGKSTEEQAEIVSTLYLMRGTSLALVIAAFDDPSAAIRRGAAAVTATVGREAAGSIPGLLKLTQDRDAAVRLQAADALLRVDDRNQHVGTWLPAVEALVRDANAPEQGPAVDLLRRLGPAAKDAASTLLSAMAGGTGVLRVEMALALIRIDRWQGPQALPILLEALDDPARPRETEVVRTVGELGPLAKDALPALRRKLNEHEKNFNQRLNVAAALARIDHDEVATCLPVVLEMLQQEPGRSLRKAEVILILIEWGPAAQPAVPVLRTMISNGSGMTRRRIGPASGEKIVMRNVAAAAVGLVLIDAEDKLGLQFIRRTIATPVESDGRWHLLYILGRLGPAAKPLANEIRPLLADADFADQARDVLAKIGPGAGF